MLLGIVALSWDVGLALIVPFRLAGGRIAGVPGLSVAPVLVPFSDTSHIGSGNCRETMQLWLHFRKPQRSLVLVPHQLQHHCGECQCPEALMLCTMMMDMLKSSHAEGHSCVVCLALRAHTSGSAWVTTTNSFSCVSTFVLIQKTEQAVHAVD